MREIRVPRQKRAQQTRERLLAAAQVEFSTNGFAGTTAKLIAKRAGVATGSFYQYFADKDAVLRELGTSRFARISEFALGMLDVDAIDARLTESAATEAAQQMGRVVVALMAYHREDPGLHAVLTERRAHDAELDRLTTEGEQTLLRAVTHLLERWDHPGDREATAFLLFHMVEGAVHAHCLGHAVVSDERFVSTLVDALVKVALPTSN